MSIQLSLPRRDTKALPLPDEHSIAWPLAALALILCLHVAVTFTRSINWDEFIVYAQIHQLARGELTLPLQTFQTRLFQWILNLDVSNIDQIIAARVVILGCVAVTASAIYFLAERFARREIALVCALAWLSTGFVIQHGTSLRTDPMAAALLMTSLAIMARTRLGLGMSLIVAGLAAVSVLITLKSVLYAPAFAGIAWLCWHTGGRSRATTLKLVRLALLVPALFAILYFVHGSYLPQEDSATAIATQTAGLMFRPFEFTHWRHSLKFVTIAPFLAILLVLIPHYIRRQTERPVAEKFALIGLALVLSSLLFYTNTYAYFFVFILPPACVACAPSVEAIVQRYSLGLLTMALTINAVSVFALEDTEVLATQRSIVEAADEIFPDPIDYFDGTHQIAQFRKANVLLDAWNIRTYFYGGHATSMEGKLDTTVVPMILTNTLVLQDALEGTDRVTLLQRVDIAMLRDTYVRFWGPYWIAGERLKASETRTVKIRVPGPYTVNNGSITINGSVFDPGEVVLLDRGTYVLGGHSSPVLLLWGDHLKRPDRPAPREPYWELF